MTLPYEASVSEVDVNSPLTDMLMEGWRDNFIDLDGRVSQVKTPAFSWILNGPLRCLPNGRRKRIDMQFLHTAVTFTKCKVSLERGGLSGTLAIDIRRHQRLNIPITAISHQFTDNIQSITNVAPASATQSIARNGSQISTQSISRAKTQLLVQSIVAVPGTNKWRYNLNTAPDSDWVVGKTFTAASCTAGGNNGSFTIVETNQSGYPSVTVINASGVAQTGVAGTLDLNLWSYNQTNPVSSDDFTINYDHVFASHTTGGNNGTFTVYKINQSGNNIWVFNASGAAQAGVAGNCNTSFWRYTYLSSVSTTDFIVGEKAKMATHTTGANNGNFTIVFVNYSATNSITVYNTAGVAQAGVAGTLNTNRWIYAMSTNPTADVIVAETVTFASATNALNNGQFTVKQINRLGTNNIVIYNESGVTQAGAVGTVTHDKKLIKFASDQSAFFTTLSKIEVTGCPDGLYNEADSKVGMSVLEVNRGGGANYNVVVLMAGGTVQSSPAGYVTIESKSIFNTAPTIAADPIALDEKRMQTVFSTDFVSGQIPENTWLGMWITSIQTGPSESLTVSLS